MSEDILRIRGKSAFAEAALARNDPDRAAEDVTELARAIALITVRSCRGDMKSANELLEGASNLMFEVATALSPFAELENLSRKRKK